MTHCAIVPFITVAHIHIKCILTFSLILESVLSVFVFPHVLSAWASAQQCIQLTLTLLECVTCPPSSVGLKWHQLLSPFIQQGVVFSFFHLIPVERQKAEPQHCSFSVLWISVCLSEMFFCIIIFFLLRKWELTRHKPKIYYLTAP